MRHAFFIDSYEPGNRRQMAGVAQFTMTADSLVWSIGLDRLAQPIAVLNCAGLVVYCNRAWLAHRQSNLGGWFLEAFSGSSYQAESRAAIAAALHTTIGGADAVQSAVYRCGDCGNQNWFRVSLRRYQVKDQFYVMAWHDEITKLRHAEAHYQQQSELTRNAELATQKMGEEAERWQLALAVNDVAVWDFDAVSRTIVGSRRWMELLNMDGGDPEPRRNALPVPIHCVHPDELPLFLRTWYELLAGTVPAMETGVHLLLHDSYRYTRLRGRVVKRDSSGTAVRVVGTMVDIHTARQMQLQAVNAIKLESIAETVAGIAHEINTTTQLVGDNVRILNDAFDSLQRCADKMMQLANEHGESIPSHAVKRCLESTDLSGLRHEISKAIGESLQGMERVARIVGAVNQSAPEQQQAKAEC